ncbi:molybdopterin molybdenumtransferase MoeA [Opitutaceae bacterium EW11]|nr:molybdopterin molybdenumtransferase MoeA [Opitutaceae bacterium EW11]
MNRVAEAEQIVSQSLPRLPAEDCPLANAHGRVLRAEVRADRDLPPYDRVTMDGFALRSSAVAAGVRRFEVVGLQAAGMIPISIADDAHCVEIATGAVLPAGADCVVPYEDASREGNIVTLAPDLSVAAGESVHRRASDHRAGDILLAPGMRLNARAVAVAAACGAATVRVSVLPRIAIVATGDELAEVETPSLAAHQVRRSNDAALRAGLLAAGYHRVESLHLRDVRAEILTALRRIVAQFDVLLVTGGVSKGKFDFLPSVLAELGVEKRIHGVSQRPGKPFWFGMTPRHTPVFALPGNPVSAYTCFRRYVLPALRQMSGLPPAPAEYAVLAEPFAFAPDLTCFLPVRVESMPDGVRRAFPAGTNTSGDLAGLVGTDGFLELPAEKCEFPAGTPARFWSWA